MSGYEIVSAAWHSNNLGAGLSGGATAKCPTGKKVLGGGVQSSNSGRNLLVVSSYPDGATQSWVGESRNISTLSIGVADVVVFAICANVQ